ncbi:methyltransferase domain-containing protein [Nocardia terpenica]|uniref:Methyltransferase domain-containing protein n=2 Tax=Nocardia terpenica TaxID=455432 RepID=A0A6G9Z7Z6_9NOCA|nr:methyltransferase domain-containing protein [Nocardia terpenica]
MPDTMTSQRIPMDGRDVRAQLAALRSDHPALYRRIDLGKAEKWAVEVAGNARRRDDFAAEEAGGRGGHYVTAQAMNVEARATGVAELFRLIRQGPPRRRTVVDMLGGDGLVSRVCSGLGLSDVDIITCDGSPYMVAAAWAHGWPALLQAAQRPLFRESSVDAVLFAYGTHHIDRELRAETVGNAHRILGADGVLVLHDFAVGGPVDIWFTDIVDRYSAMGHPYPHFTADEVDEYLAKAGFSSWEVLEIDDPIIATGETAERAELNLGAYLVNMYGLVEAQAAFGEHEATVWAVAQAREIFRYSTVGGEIDCCAVDYDLERRAWRARLPRKAIVGVGRKA